jgi:hypothetical protein
MKDTARALPRSIPAGKLDERAFAEQRNHHWQEIQPAGLGQNILGQPRRPAKHSSAAVCRTGILTSRG